MWSFVIPSQSLYSWIKLLQHVALRKQKEATHEYIRRGTRLYRIAPLYTVGIGKELTGKKRDRLNNTVVNTIICGVQFLNKRSPKVSAPDTNRLAKQTWTFAQATKDLGCLTACVMVSAILATASQYIIGKIINRLWLDQIALKIFISNSRKLSWQNSHAHYACGEAEINLKPNRFNFQIIKIH